MENYFRAWSKVNIFDYICGGKYNFLKKLNNAILLIVLCLLNVYNTAISQQGGDEFVRDGRNINMANEVNVWGAQTGINAGWFAFGAYAIFQSLKIMLTKNDKRANTLKATIVRLLAAALVLTILDNLVD